MLKNISILKLISTSVLLLCLSLWFTLYAQGQQQDLSIKANEFVYSNPDESIKIAEHILKTTNENQGKAMANLLLSQSYLVKGDYNKSIVYAFDESNQLDDVDVNTKIENLIIKATLLRKLHLNSQSQEYLNKAKVLLNSAAQSSKDSLLTSIKFEEVKMLLDRRNTLAALDSLHKIENDFKTFLAQNANQKTAMLLGKGLAFSDLTKFDSAFVYINKTISEIDASQVNNLYEKAIIYRELGHLELQKKEFNKSEETLFIALKFAEILDNPFLLEQINQDLAINYLASNQKTQHRVYNDEFLILNTKAELIEQESVNTVYNILSEQNEKRLLVEEQKYTNYLYILLAAILFVIIIGSIILLKSEGRKKRLREIINYLEVSRTNFIKTKVSNKKTSKASKKYVSIPEETEKALLLKISRFEKSQKFLSKDMSLAVLAGSFETNTKYLSGVINKHYNDNFNTFINKLRINYIIEKLKSDSNYMNYKISFLASECGFSSHSSFATVFKSIIGMSPVTFIELLKQEREELNKSSA